MRLTKSMAPRRYHGDIGFLCASRLRQWNAKIAFGVGLVAARLSVTILNLQPPFTGNRTSQDSSGPRRIVRSENDFRIADNRLGM
jgi:hypothetical protein